MIDKSLFKAILVLSVIVPISLFYYLNSEMNEKEVKSKFLYTSGDSRTDASGVYGGRLWRTNATQGKLLLGETPFARCDVHSVMVESDTNGVDKPKKVINDWIFLEERDAINVAVFTTARKLLAFKQKKYAIPGETLSIVGGFINNDESPFDAARREVLEELGVGSGRTKEILTNRTKNDIKVGGKRNKKNERESSAFESDVFTTMKKPIDVDEYNLLIGDVSLDERNSWVYLGKYRTMANRGGGFIYTYMLKDAIPLVEGGGTSEYISQGDDETQLLLQLNLQEAKKAVLEGQFQEVKWAATLSLALLHLQA